MNRFRSLIELFTAKKIFWVLILFCVILLPLLSINAGISGDEPVHYRHAGYVNKYFSSGKSDDRALDTPITNLKYYGQVVDNISFAINEVFGFKNPYPLRHLINAFLGVLLILFTSLISIRYAGYTAGILTALFLLLSPRILGHSLNNLKDIPFALGYILSIWGLFGAMQAYPKFKLQNFIGMGLGFALAFGIRAGGLLIIPIIFLFSFLNWVNNHYKEGLFTKNAILPGLKLFTLLLITLSAGYILGILFWPYALLDPIRNPIESLGMMTHYEVSIRTVFNGAWAWSEKLPWFYGTKWILISTPLIILAGFVIHFARLKKALWPLISLLVFSALFPLLWTILKNSNLYGGYRHLLFIYPLICIVSASGWMLLNQKIENKYLKILLIASLVAGLIGPSKHIVKNYPVHYVYFNKLVGSAEKANGRYDMDYYFHGIGPAFDWLEKKLLKEGTFNNLIIASNFEINEYKNSNKLEFVGLNLNYYSRGKENWDYGIFSSTYIDPVQLQNGNWPPKNAIYTVFVDSVPVCAVIERKSKNDLLALEAFRNSEFLLADSLYREVLKDQPYHETSLLYQAWTWRHMSNFSKSDSIAHSLLGISPLSDNALDLIARNHISQEQFNQAVETLLELLKNNYKYLPAYEQLGIAYQRLGLHQKQAQALEMGYDLGLRDRSSLLNLVQALETIGEVNKAEKFRTILNKL